MKRNYKQIFLQLVKFAAVGILNSVISEGTYMGLMYIGVHYIPAYFIGFSLSVLNAYYWNNKYVFKASDNCEKRVWWKVLGKTYLAYSTGLTINLLMLFMWMDIIVISRYFNGLSVILIENGFTRATPRFLAGVFASLIDMMLTVPLNFAINKLWAFRQKEITTECAE